jgi:ATP-dependent Clp protease ATP-binding subunit ClpB
LDTVLNLETHLAKRVIGQDHAMKMIAKRIQTSRAGLDNPNKPIGVFMLAGTSGVGKTETALALAEVLYGGEHNVITINMSEYQEAHTVSSLKGAPPGYVGYGEGGVLTEAVRRKPYSVVLLDEVEKAHPDVFNILLQVLDDGRLTDGKGRTVDFKNTVIIMTSNLGSDIIQEVSGESNYQQMKGLVMGAVGEHFRPEFLNRVDDIVVFHPLGKEQITAIAKIQLRSLRERLTDKGYKLELSLAALEKIADAGFDPVYGARPLKRAIQTEIENPLAQKILAGDLAENGIVKIDVRGSEITIL